MAPAGRRGRLTAAAGLGVALAPWRARVARHLDDLTAPVAVGCSGGCDSVALLALAVDAGLAPVAVHVDHGLRPESAAEADAVAELARALGASFAGLRVDVPAGSNLEARARTARYAALEQARLDAGAAHVLVAHTADDQAETVLLNVLRGAAADGLAGMARRHGTVVRPLLDVRRADTRAICTQLGLATLEDPMNDDPGFRRVAIRREVLPLLARVAERDLVPVLARQADILRAESEYLDAVATAAWPAADEPTTAALLALPPVIARRALRAWLGHPRPSAAELERVLRVVSGEARRAELSGGRVVGRARGRLALTR